jgi:mutator family transposase
LTFEPSARQLDHLAADLRVVTTLHLGRTLCRSIPNQEVGRRTDVGIFPDDQSLIRLAGMLCIEQDDEWLVRRGYLSAESISLALAGPDIT